MEAFRDLRLESKSLGQAWLNLNEDVTQLEQHKLHLKDEWKQLETQRDRLKRDRDRFENLIKQEWFPNSNSCNSKENESEGDESRVIKLNIGGQMFEVSHKLLLKDRFSLLAATAVPEEDSILKPEENGSFYFDRDWWLFRHILGFLRDSILPEKESLLRDLFHEAAFYCLSSMQREILLVLTERRNKKKAFSQLQAQRDTYDIELESNRKQRKVKRKNKNKHKKKQYYADELPDPFGFTSRTKTRVATVL